MKVLINLDSAIIKSTRANLSHNLTKLMARLQNCEKPSVTWECTYCSQFLNAGYGSQQSWQIHDHVSYTSVAWISKTWVYRVNMSSKCCSWIPASFNVLGLGASLVLPLGRGLGLLVWSTTVIGVVRGWELWVVLNYWIGRERLRGNAPVEHVLLIRGWIHQWADCPKWLVEGRIMVGSSLHDGMTWRVSNEHLIGVWLWVRSSHSRSLC